MKTPLRPAAVILAALLLGGCASFRPVRVQPWERATLADELMNPRRAPLDAAFSEHTLFSREGSAGGAGVGGSGCGCN